ncbi:MULTISPECIES: GIY-YIG nuclease family protein [unclassified Bradyrhizobium]|uniref:GIY-YIG nuclease family protein n=1 Tax=unclassified Bradyrhizobium TaxID=2631580 RepID=UPI0028ED0175|nr:MULTISPECIES: GIY-YIG nuclease family protein [unclassified Bradyrhizobium]
MTEGAYLYILLCADGRLYIGTTRTSLELRLAQHNDGSFGGYTLTRRPVQLIYSQWFERITDAIENERRLKKWTRAKKEALIRGDLDALQALSARRTTFEEARDSEKP